MRIVIPGKTLFGERPVVPIVALVTAVAGVLLLVGMLDAVFAQAGPFGGPRPQAAGAPSSGLLGWIFAEQAEFYRRFSSLIRASKADGNAVWGLLGLSFLYGIFHAAGPGHGKAVISSYIVANGETWTRGVTLSFASAILQALVAVTVVGVAAALLNVTAATMGRAVNAIEIASYSVIILIGSRLLWVKGRAFIAALRTLHRPASLGAAVTPPDYLRHQAQPRLSAHSECAHHHHHACDHDHHSHSDHHDDGGCQGHDHDDHASAWGHAHAPEPEELAGPGGWKRGFSAIVAVGLRPCSGAILVLVFALTQGLFWAGVAATIIMGFGTAVTVAVIATIAVGARSWAKRLAECHSGYGLLAMRAIEVAAAALIVAFGGLLLAGYMVAERLVAI